MRMVSHLLKISFPSLLVKLIKSGQSVTSSLGDEMEAKFTGFKTLSENAVKKLFNTKPTTCSNDPIPSKL